MTLRISIGLAMTVVALAIAGRRVLWLGRLVTVGQPAPERLTGDYGRKLASQVVEVFGQKKLLQWSIPGAAHFVTFWGFVILALTIVEAYAALFKQDWAGFSQSSALGFIEDLFALLVLVGIATFAVIRLVRDPRREGRRSRFYGSHTGAAWVILGMISLVVLTLIIYRGAQINTGNFPYTSPSPKWAFFSYGVSRIFDGLSYSTNHAIETTFILGQLAVIMVFLVLVVHSKHLHIFIAPVNVMFGRKPKALGAVEPMRAGGEIVDFEKAMESEEEIPFGVGKVEDFTWKGLLDFSTCTECGRCQSQCPAWNTAKPLSPKLLITDLRDHLFDKAPWLLGGTPPATAEGTAAGTAAAVRGQGEAAGGTHPDVNPDDTGHRPSHNPNNVPENERPLVGTAEEGGVIDPDVLWACTNCGACVEQCPVDIEHVDHIINLRRYQVLVESSFPSEAGVMLRNVENHGNPWGVSSRTRSEWYADLPFEVRVLDGPGAAGSAMDDIEYLFWVGCAGAIDDRGKKTSQALAELLHAADVSFAVLGEGETCTGDPVRRIGNEYLWSELARANVELLNEAAVKKIVVTCPHCYNSLANEYKEVGGQYDVVHHTELLSRLISEGRLTPVERLDAKVTYHDPCFLGRHNSIYTPPREVIGSLPGVTLTEMPRHGSRSFCCGAGGGRMWLEEKIGKRVNVERVEEALDTQPDVVAVGCPFCSTMISDGVTSKQAEGIGAGVEVLDVARLFARAMRKVEPPATALGGGGTATTVLEAPPAPPETADADRAVPESAVPESAVPESAVPESAVPESATPDATSVAPPAEAPAEPAEEQPAGEAPPAEEPPPAAEATGGTDGAPAPPADEPPSSEAPSPH